MKLTAILMIALLPLLSGTVGAAEPAANVLGITLDMPEAEVRRRLDALGATPIPGMVSSPSQEMKEAQEEDPAGLLKQTWKLRRGAFEYVALRFGRDHRVKWVTAFARPGKRSVRYKDLGDPDRATRMGNYIYVWRVNSSEKHDGYMLAARGTDPTFAGSVSLTSLTLDHNAPPASALPDTMYYVRR